MESKNAESRSTAPQARSAVHAERTIELGWVLVGDLDDDALQALADAIDAARRRLSELFAAFDWHCPFVRLSQPAEQREEPIDLLQAGAQERAARHWDFAFVVTNSELNSYRRPLMIAAPAQALNVAVISLRRLWAVAALGPGEHLDRKREQQRLAALAVHLLGDLNGLGHATDRQDYMYAADDVADFEKMTRLEHGDELHDRFEEIADVRLEERSTQRRHATLPFYLHAAWIGRRTILDSIVQARPWEFPLRFSRLTTAGFSTLFVLMITAEAWELGFSQGVGSVLSFAILALTCMTIYILRRQNLMLTRAEARLSEQAVFTNVAITAIVALGLLTTYALLLIAVLVASYAFFEPALIERWGAATGFNDRLRFSAFHATLGVIIGSLGASFEGQRYFQHIAYVDEEL